MTSGFNADREAMVARMTEHLRVRPDDRDGGSMPAHTYTMEGKFRVAADDIKRVVDLSPEDERALADDADARATANHRSREGEPEKLNMQAVMLDPANISAMARPGDLQSPSAPMAVGAGGPRIEIGGSARR